MRKLPQVEGWRTARPSQDELAKLVSGLTDISPIHSCRPPALNPVYLHVHDWLRERNYTCSTGPHDTAYQGAHGTHLSWFDHVRSVPANSQDFDKIMAASLLGRPAWIETYPAAQRLIEGFLPERRHGDNDGPVLFVDVGGGRGHCTEQLIDAFPDAPGRLVVQDLPVVTGEVVDTEGLHPRIERMGYDFFDEQPIKGESLDLSLRIPILFPHRTNP